MSANTSACPSCAFSCCRICWASVTCNMMGHVTDTQQILTQEKVQLGQAEMSQMWEYLTAIMTRRLSETMEL